MNLFETVNRLYEIHRLILPEKTGIPDEFAERFHLSRRQLYNIMDELKDLGAEIKYSRIEYIFYYVNDFDIKINQLHLSSKDNKETF
jgi:predicted DNA-binding transcriptional regulator YafY